MSGIAMAGVSMSFGRPGSPDHVVVLDAQSFELARGSFAVVRGPSGSGKTTLLGLLGMLLRPAAGEVRLFSEEVGSLPEAARSRLRRTTVGIAFQEVPIIARAPAWENVALPLLPLGIGRGERRAQAIAMLSEVDLDRKADVPARALSAGERQRLGLARCFVMDPPVLLVDEVTAGLDAASAALARQAIERRWRAGATVVAASHDPDLRGDREIRLDSGRIEEAG